MEFQDPSRDNVSHRVSGDVRDVPECFKGFQSVSRGVPGVFQVVCIGDIVGGQVSRGPQHSQRSREF